ncbi:MAG: hypothetical protein GY703_00470 [Gammaproteobacteria bacterium]|nr:hypothetical protein [Gammaproteobacteria bacterium]
MITENEQIFSFRVSNPEMVDDLTELWRGSIVDCDPKQKTVRVRSDSVAVGQFIAIYSTYLYCNSVEDAFHPWIKVEQELWKNLQTTH